MDTPELPVPIDGESDQVSAKGSASPDSDANSVSQPVVLPVVFVAAGSGESLARDESASEEPQDSNPTSPSANVSEPAIEQLVPEPTTVPESEKDATVAAPTGDPQKIDAQGDSTKVPSEPKTEVVEDQPQPMASSPDSQVPGVEAIAQRIRRLKNPRMNSDSIAEPPIVSTSAADQPAHRELPRVPQLQVLVQLADARSLFAKVMQDVAKEQAEALRKIAIYEIEQAFFKYRASQRAADKGLRGPLGY